MSIAHPMDDDSICPRCGSDDVAIKMWVSLNEEKYSDCDTQHITCWSCGARSNFHLERHEYKYPETMLTRGIIHG